MQQKISKYQPGISSLQLVSGFCIILGQKIQNLKGTHQVKAAGRIIQPEMKRFFQYADTIVYSIPVAEQCGGCVLDASVTIQIGPQCLEVFALMGTVISNNCTQVLVHILIQ